MSPSRTFVRVLISRCEPQDDHRPPEFEPVSDRHSQLHRRSISGLPGSRSEVGNRRRNCQFNFRARIQRYLYFDNGLSADPAVYRL